MFYYSVLMVGHPIFDFFAFACGRGILLILFCRFNVGTRPAKITCQWTRPGFCPFCPAGPSASAWPRSATVRQTPRPRASSRVWPRGRRRDHDGRRRRRGAHPADCKRRQTPFPRSIMDINITTI
jgi:hypothetical protein